jgi:hypothetical protein
LRTTSRANRVTLFDVVISSVQTNMTSWYRQFAFLFLFGLCALPLSANGQSEATILKLAASGSISAGGLLAHSFYRRQEDTNHVQYLDSTANFSGSAYFRDKWGGDCGIHSEYKASISGDTLQVSTPNNCDAGKVSVVAIFDTVARVIRSLTYSGGYYEGFGMGYLQRDWSIQLINVGYLIDSAGNVVCNVPVSSMVSAIHAFNTTSTEASSGHGSLPGTLTVNKCDLPIDTTASSYVNLQLGANKLANLVVAKRSINAMQIFPNPATSTLTVTSASGSDLHQVKLFDILGRERLARNTSLSATELSLDVSSLEKGSYVLVTSTGRTIFSVQR